MGSGKGSKPKSRPVKKKATRKIGGATLPKVKVRGPLKPPPKAPSPKKGGKK